MAPYCCHCPCPTSGYHRKWGPSSLKEIWEEGGVLYISSCLQEGGMKKGETEPSSEASTVVEPLEELGICPRSWGTGTTTDAGLTPENSEADGCIWI